MHVISQKQIMVSDKDSITILSLNALTVSQETYKCAITEHYFCHTIGKSEEERTDNMARSGNGWMRVLLESLRQHL